MQKESVFTMKLEQELRDEFMAEAQAAHRPASQVVRELMREYVQRQRESRAYDAYMRNKVELARTSVRPRLGRAHDDVETRFAARRNELGYRVAEPTPARKSKPNPKKA